MAIAASHLGHIRRQRYLVALVEDWVQSLALDSSPEWLVGPPVEPLCRQQRLTKKTQHAVDVTLAILVRAQQVRA